MFIVQLYDIDKKNEMRLAPKLTDCHIAPNNFEKIKVRYAAQVLSATVAAALQKLIISNSISNDALATVDFIRKMSDLFDMYNSSTVVHAVKYRQTFTGKDYQIKFLLELKEYLKRITIFTKQGTNISNKVKVFKYWYQNINSLLKMWDYLRISAPEVKFLLMRRFNQDSVENFFGTVRGMNGNAFNPTPIQFYYSFKKVFSVNFCASKTGNCEPDNDKMLSAIINIPSQTKIYVENKISESESICLDNHDYRTMDINEQDAFRYICGYLIRKCLTKHSCDLCVNYAKEYTDLNTSFYCFFRAYNSSDENIFGNLYMPNNNFIEYVKNLEDIFAKKIKEYVLQKSVISNFVQLFKQVNFIHSCQYFPQDYMIKLYARVRLFFTLKFANKRFKTQSAHRKCVILRHE